MALGKEVWRENRLAREKKSAGAACFDEGANYGGYAPESPAAVGAGRFVPWYLPQHTVIFCGVSQCFTGTPMVALETIQNQCQCMAAVNLECMSTFPTAWLFL